LPTHAVAQVIRDRLAVGADAAVLLRGNLAREIGRRTPAVVDHAQRAEDRFREIVLVELYGMQGIERIRLLDEPDPQRSRLGRNLRR
jgi:hypothetical protein